MQMRILNNSKHRHAIHLKFEDLFSISLSKLVLKAKASIYSAIKANLPAYCLKLSVFVILVII